MPSPIRAAVDRALAEWEASKGSGIADINKYSLWWTQFEIGWCGAFVGYCLDKAGVGMRLAEDSVPVPDGSPYAVRAAGVGKFLSGYRKMDRLSNITETRIPCDIRSTKAQHSHPCGNDHRC